MASGTRPLGGRCCRPEHAAALAKIAALSGQAMEQLAPDPMGALNAPSRMMRSVGKETAHGIIRNQIFRRTWMFASGEQVISLMEKATMRNKS